MPQIRDRKWTSRLKKGKLKDVHTKIQSEQIVKRQGEFESRKRKASKRAIRRLPGDFQQTPCMAEGRKMVASDERAGKRKLPSKNRRDFPDKQKQFITTQTKASV